MILLSWMLDSGATLDSLQSAGGCREFVQPVHNLDLEKASDCVSRGVLMGSLREKVGVVSGGSWPPPGLPFVTLHLFLFGQNF